MSDNAPIKCDLAVVGTGLAGVAASVFAANRGLTVAQAGMTGSLAYTTGIFDLLGAIPAAEEGGKARVVDEPFLGIADLLKQEPGHPYSRFGREKIETALDEFLNFLRTMGITYRRGDTANLKVLTPVGTIKRTYCVPRTMWAGTDALEKKAPCLILGIEGLKGFSEKQIVANLKGIWPGIRGARLTLPGHRPGEVYLESVARKLELARERERFAEAVRPLLGDAEAVGLPAMLGMHNPGEVIDHLEELLGVSLFEIPTMPPGVPGIRLKEAFEDRLPEMGVELFCQQKMTEVSAGPSGFRLRVTGQNAEREIEAGAVLLASGRFLGGGLSGAQKGIREPLFNLPVVQPETRSGWHRLDYLDPRGHAVHRTGIQTDEFFRPLGRDGKPAYENLFAAGSILAHQDWIRMKCGAGVAVTTAFAAVEAVLRLRG